MWDAIKKFFGGAEKAPKSEQPTYEVIHETPWQVPVLDVQPLTQHVVSASQDPQIAGNAVSYTGDDGAELALQAVESERVVDCELRFPFEAAIVDGVVAAPRAMEDKWAIYVNDGEVLFIRSWLRKVVARAPLRVEGDEIVVGPVRGVFTEPEETEAYTARVFEYLLRDFGLGEGLPAPIPFDFSDNHDETAQFAFAVFGRQARFVTHHDAVLQPSSTPLSTHTRLHMAVAKGSADDVRDAIVAGVPVDYRGPDGQTALHWAASIHPKFIETLLEAGVPIDMPTRDGTTLLMQAVELRNAELVQQALDLDADVNAADHRGFTALHRAAEMGELSIVERLLDCGAQQSAAKAGPTPLALAEQREEVEIVRRLRAASDGSS